MTYSMIVGKYKLIFSDTHFKDFRKKPTISVYDADTNSETKIASFNSRETFEWFIEAVVKADRKTEPTGYNLLPVEDEPLTCDGNCWMKKQNGEWLCEHCQRKPQTEPTISKMEQVDEPQTCSFSDCDNFKNPDYERCIECKRKQIKPKTEQTERSE